MPTPSLWWLYLAAAVPFWLLDAIWLGLAAKSFYKSALGPLMARKVKWVPGAVFYLAYPVGLALFVLAPNWTALGVLQMAGLGGLFGLFCYGTYDLTNHATLEGWPLRLTLVDMVWGSCATASACGVARLMLA